MRAADAAIRGRIATATVLVVLAALIGPGSSNALADSVSDRPNVSDRATVSDRPSVSDRLILLQADARSYVEQHTLFSNGQLLVVPLPADRISLETRFSGPERQTFTSAHERSPERVSLWSGSVLTRFRHRYGAGLTEPEPGVFALDTRTEHAAVQVDEPADIQWSISWVLPDNARLLDFKSQNDDAGGRWTHSGPLLSYQQSGGTVPGLTLRFSLTPFPGVAGQPDRRSCRQPNAFSDLCSPDTDGDEIPDYRDVCLPPDSQVAALTEPQRLASPLPERAARNNRADPAAMQAIGCSKTSVVTLAGIRFNSGQSDLNLASRRVLDRLARALQRLPERLFEISTHTDNAGRVTHNQNLSDTRARAIRHYLMLRGVPGSQIRARGLGETSPAYDNALAAGRRANRRVELTVSN